MTWGPFYPAITVVLATLLLTSCVASEDSGDETSSDNASPNKNGTSSEGSGPVASATTTGTELGDKLDVDITSLGRTDDGKALLEISVTNNGDIKAYTNRYFTAHSRFGGILSTGMGVTLIDTKNGKRYFSLMRDDNDSCLCSSWDGESILEKGDTLDFWVAYPEPPKDVDRMTVTTPITPDIVDVPLSSSINMKRNFEDIPTKEPKILDLTSIQEDLDGDSSRSDTGDETSIMLSSDVLFDTNESKLTSKANKSLTRVAKEIDSSSSTTVRIDGYTDSTGNDSINKPLSKDRADSVRKKLEELVTRSGVTFETAGHGSSDPVADNSTEEGKAKNRRVTVTFTK
ncbi:OmpA family protein [Nocardiopsis rhodophaea]